LVINKNDQRLTPAVMDQSPRCSFLSTDQKINDLSGAGSRPNPRQFSKKTSVSLWFERFMNEIGLI